MAENIFLKTEREKRGWSQGEIADKIRCGAASYHRWEKEGVLPSPYYRQELSALFGKSMEELGLLPSRGRHASAILPKGTDLDLAEIHQALNASLFLQLCTIMDEPVHECRCEKYAGILEEFEEMNTQNELAAAMTRRQAVVSLALLPFSPPLGLAEERVYTMPASKHDLFLQQVRAALVACEDLANSPDRRDIHLAFRVCSRYLSELKQIAKSSPKERMRALELACRFAILRADSGWCCVGDIATLPLAREAVEIAQELGHIELHLSALSKLAWAYVSVGEEPLALRTAEQAKALLERYKDPLPVCIYGGTWSTFSVVQARNFLDPDYAIKRAGERGSPGNKIPYVYGMQFTEPYALQEQGIARGYYGQTGIALAAYSQIIDRASLEIVPAFQGIFTEQSRLNTILHMAEASLTGGDRDMGEAIRYWEYVHNVKKKGKQTESKIFVLYREMLRMFPGEERIKKLGEQLREKAGNNPGES